MNTQAITPPGRSAAPPVLALLACVYLAQALPNGFMYTALPAILREQGASASAIGWMGLLFLPWVAKILYAGWVDHASQRLQHGRLQYVWHAQWLAALALVVAAWLAPAQQLLWLAALLLLANVCFATGDVAADGYATDKLTPANQTAGNTIQYSGGNLGMILGGSGLLLVYGWLGWRNSMLTLALLVLLLSLPLRSRKAHAPVAHDRQAMRPAVMRSFRSAHIRRIGGFFVLLSLAVGSGQAMMGPIMVDHGLSAGEIGKLMLLFTQPLLVIGGLLAWLLRKHFSSKALVASFMLLAIVARFPLVHALLPDQWQLTQVVVALALANLTMGAVGVLMFNLMMDVSRSGMQPATDFAVMTSLMELAFMLMQPVYGNIAQHWSFLTLHVSMLIIAIPCAWFAVRAFSRADLLFQARGTQ